MSRFMIAAALLCLAAVPLRAQDENPAYTATIVKLEGEVKLLRYPSVTVKKSDKQVLYDGKYYSYKIAQIGDQLRRNEVLQATAKAKAKLIYSNGDQILVAPSTSYRIVEGKEGRTVIDMFFGQLRSVIRPKSARENMVVRSRTLVMGVRGTDFVITDPDPKGQGVVSVLRGKVSTLPLKEGAKEVEVPAGSSMTLDPKKEEAKAPVSVEPTTKTMILAIQKATAVTKPTTEELASLDPTIKTEVETLEKQSIDATLEDIQKNDPKAYEALKGNAQEFADADQIHAATLKRSFEEAPLENKISKPSAEELKDLGQDVYKKYFGE